jgi:hypothetical protein
MDLQICKTEFWPGFDDWLIFTLGVLVTIGWALFIYSLRPKLEIGLPSFSREREVDILNVPIKNIGRKRKATRLKLEIAVVDDNFTYHLASDSDDFAFLNGNQTKKFKVYKVNDFLSSVYQMNMHDALAILNDDNTMLRIRIHATDSFSGLGETFEKCFEACNSDYIKGGFKIKIEKKL